MKADFVEIAPRRLDHLNSLAFFQDLYLEFMVGEAEYYKLTHHQALIGYAIRSPEKTLIEFHLLNRFPANAQASFNEIVEQLAVSQIYCQSFDALLLNSCLTNRYPYELIGSLYREEGPGGTFPLGDLSVRLATADDLPLLQGIEDEVFEPKNRLQRDVEKRGIFLFHKGGELVGCGFLTQIHASWDYFDLGVWTHPDHRRQGVASRIVSHLKMLCREREISPICGCDIANLASQNTLTKCGFFCRHSLIEFKVPS